MTQTQSTVSLEAPPERQLGVPFSVVIPSYNRAALVGRAIESVLAQTHAPREILVVDDGSTDDTAARLVEYADRVRIVRQSNLGGAAARNRGVELATCKWIAFLDSDDLWLPDHLERVAIAIESTGGGAGFYFRDVDRNAADGGGHLWEAGGFSIDDEFEFVEDGSDWALRPLQPMMLQSAVFDRAAYLEVGGLDRRLTRRHDTDLFFKMSLNRPVCAVRGAGCEFTADDDTGARLTRKHDGESVTYWRCTIRMYRDALRRARGSARRGEIRRRLAIGYWRLSRAHGRRGAWPCATWNGLRSLKVAPSVALEAVARWLRRKGK